MKRKYLMSVAAALIICSVSSASYAQEKKQEKKKTEVGKALQKTGNAIEKGATAVGNKTAEVAVKGTAKVADKVWDGKMAPDGSDVYIDSKNRKYYVNKKGAKIYLKSSQIKNRPKKDNN
ncbi:hypothetical protein [Pedobacter sp.]|uniref:hypothetical protein n=1 Tax=Pedobacter sp. TaxID=1411316 RepID=UPI00396CFC20